jgi:hypothetical protein
MTMETMPETELVLIEPRSDQFFMAIQNILKGHSGRPIRMVGTDEG